MVKEVHIRLRRSEYILTGSTKNDVEIRVVFVLNIQANGGDSCNSASAASAANNNNNDDGYLDENDNPQVTSLPFLFTILMVILMISAFIWFWWLVGYVEYFWQSTTKEEERQQRSIEWLSRQNQIKLVGLTNQNELKNVMPFEPNITVAVRIQQLVNQLRLKTKNERAIRSTQMTKRETNIMFVDVVVAVVVGVVVVF